MIFAVAGADFAQGISSSPYLIDEKARKKYYAKRRQNKKRVTAYEVKLLQPGGEEVTEELELLHHNIVQWEGYVKSEDPGLLLAYVPEGWPPQSREVMPLTIYDERVQVNQQDFYLHPKF